MLCVVVHGGCMYGTIGGYHTGRQSAGGRRAVWYSPYSQPTREPLKKYKRMMNKHGMEIFWADDDKNYGMDKLQTRE